MVQKQIGKGNTMQDKDTRFDLAQLAESALELLLTGTLEGGGVLGDYLSKILTNEKIRRSHAAAGRPEDGPVMLEVPLLKPTQVTAGIADAERTIAILARAGERTGVAFVQALLAQLQRQQAQFDIRLS
jgi:hypothetical protein